jgi:hypothetical protein
MQSPREDFSEVVLRVSSRTPRHAVSRFQYQWSLPTDLIASLPSGSFIAKTKIAMALTKLEDRLAVLPRVLAGPILRKVTPTSVTVWVALQGTASVTLTVKDDHSTEVMVGTRSTVAVGANLHIVAVTAHPKPPATGLTEGTIYQYDLDFGSNMNLAAATKNAELAYAPYQLPSFTLPPSDLGNARIFCGSCRMPHGNGPDALALLDVLIEQAASNAQSRPHQLLLMGDQIYADDVSDALLLLLTDAGDTLLNGTDKTKPTQWTEILPVVNKPSSSLPPYWRIKPLRFFAQFTSADLRSHLMSLGEYIAMYLFAWSDVLWPTDPVSGSVVLATVAEIETKAAGADLDLQQAMHIPLAVNDASAWARTKIIKDDNNSVTEFHDTLFRVRKALANIPTSMIFDDHEVTDDWNMTLGFCKDVYGNPLGRRIVQNALVAYALCQHWGNAPEQFESATPQPSGAALLQLLDKGTASSYIQNTTQIQKIVGVRDQPGQRNPDPNAFTYNYSIEATAYQVIVTDTRTWRAFPDGDNETGQFLPVNQSTDQLKAQIASTPDLKGRALLVVLTTNAPEIEGLRSATRHDVISRGGSGFLKGDPHPDIYDGWELPSVSFDRLLVRLIDKLPTDAGKLHGSIILLSGDVHHSFATRLKYSANRRFEDATAKPAVAVFAQLVASSFKKQTSDTIDIHKEGYTWAIPAIGTPPYMAEGYVGFNLPAGVALGQRHLYWPGLGGFDFWLDFKSDATPTILLGSNGIEQYGFLDPAYIKLSKSPDYRYRLDYLKADRQGAQSITPPTIPPISGATPESRQNAISAFNAATNHYRDYNYNGTIKQAIIGLNNICEVTFVRGSAGLTYVNHTVRWKLQGVADFQWATYNVHVDPNDDTGFPELRAGVEP